MKIVICTTPIRPEPTSYPPFGSMALISSLRAAGHDPYFYDIDGLRPSFEEVSQFFREYSPDMVGISAVVSTAYSYTKRLAADIKSSTPNAKIVVGGNLAASAEILLRLCEIDVCGIGEGENIITELANYWEGYQDGDDYSKLGKIKGLSYLGSDNEMAFTGYVTPIPAEDFQIPDWKILEQYSDIDLYVHDPITRHDLARDPRSYEPHRRGKKLATTITAKGCVARCTFCHRWDRGYRHWEVDRIIENITYLMDNYNVGFISFGDENFGSDRRKLDDFIERISELDIIYQVSGVRCRSVDPDVLARLKASGCAAMYYGMETGSPRMLEVMEKGAKIQNNLDAALWTHQAGIHTIYQMVLGMPGEDRKTISETSAFIQSVTEYLPEPPDRRLSINYIQALPGTPVYEYARSTGQIGNSLEEEEKYLISISDVDASDDSTFLNFTQDDYLTVQSWRQKILFEAGANWYKKHNWKNAANGSSPAITNAGAATEEVEEDYRRGGYFNLSKTIIRHPNFYRVMSSPLGLPLRFIYPVTFVLAKNLKNLPKRRVIAHVGEYLKRRLIRASRPKEFVSLRKVMKERTSIPLTKSEESMLPMREGR